jgi:hypothetical protein
MLVRIPQLRTAAIPVHFCWTCLRKPLDEFIRKKRECMRRFINRGLDDEKPRREIDRDLPWFSSRCDHRCVGPGRIFPEKPMVFSGWAARTAQKHRLVSSSKCNTMANSLEVAQWKQGDTVI